MELVSSSSVKKATTVNVMQPQPRIDTGKGKLLTQTPAAKPATGLVPHCCHAGSRLAAAASRGELDPSSAISQTRF